MCGHVHRPIQLRWAGTMASIAPSTAHQATLDLRETSTFSMMMEPPGLALHLWRPGTGLITHISYVGTYPGPHPFRAMQ
jgi:3',5'-cyclic-AMP phosphodiesterase